MKKLLILVADKNMEYLMKSLLKKIQIVEGMKEFPFQILVHPQRDAGVLNGADEFLRSFVNDQTNILVLLDHEGCGQERKTRDTIELEIETRLNDTGGGTDSNCVICIAPELENWIWVKEEHIQNAIGWNKREGIYSWLVEQGLKEEAFAKPKRPKESFEAALRICKTPRSSSIYFDIAQNASYRTCKDPGFLKLHAQLIKWYQ